jgi:hypothetical protein
MSASEGQNSHLQARWDQLQQQLAPPISLATKSGDQVCHAQHLSMALGVYEMGDSEVFDDLPQWDEEPQRQFDEMLNSGVVWDEEFEHSPMHDNVFDEVFSEAVLDEGGQDMPDQHGLLKKLTIDADAWVGKHKMYAE